MLAELGRHESVNTRDTTVLEFQVHSSLEVNFLPDFILVFNTKQYKNANIANFV